MAGMGSLKIGRVLVVCALALPAMLAVPANRAQGATVAKPNPCVKLVKSGNTTVKKKVCLIDVKGDGSYTTKNFSAPPTGWKIHYKYSCTWGDTQGFFISVGDARNPSLKPQAIVGEDENESGSGVSPKLNGGQWYLKIDTFLSECTWRVWVPKS